VEVPYGAESYIDEIEGPGAVYYFAVASDEWGQKYEIHIPFGNSISVQVSASAEGLAASTGDPAAPGPAPEAASAVWEQGRRRDGPSISGISAVVEGEKVIISFNAGEGEKPVLYRSVRPFNETMDLPSAVIVQSEISSPFIDYPVLGIPYYYAVIPEQDIITGTVEIKPGANATIESVEVPAGRRTDLSDLALTIRSVPLPHISLQTASPGMNAFSDTPARSELKSETAKALEDIPSLPKKEEPLKRPRAFREDLLVPAGGEEDTLRSIVQGSFAKKDWESAGNELKRYLSLPRTRASEARARFYLGQCRYFSGAYRESLFEFLAVQSDYPDEAAEWIQSALNMMTN
jgi:hypothetical protein